MFAGSVIEFLFIVVWLWVNGHPVNDPLVHSVVSIVDNLEVNIHLFRSGLPCVSNVPEYL